MKSASQLAAAFDAFDFARRERSQRVSLSSREFGRLYLSREGDTGYDVQKIRQFMGPRAMFAEAIDLRKQNEVAIARFHSQT